jgi:predicted kinase
MKILYIIRGLPGSGKSTLAKRLCPNHHFEADQYHMVGGEYRFDPAKAKKAHEWCQACTAAILAKRQYDVAVSNTFTQRWEYQPYLNMAKEAGYDVQVIECHGPWKNVHNVPDEVLAKMRQRWEPHHA